MTAPIDIILDRVKWLPVPVPEEAPDMPYTTYEGTLNFLGHDFKVYQLSNGQRVFDAEDLERFFGETL